MSRSINFLKRWRVIGLLLLVLLFSYGWGESGRAVVRRGGSRSLAP
jgi:hypothetical protein